MSRRNEMIFIRNDQTNRLMDVTGDDVACWNSNRQHIEKAANFGFRATLGKLLLAGFCFMLALGCSESATELTAWQKAMRDGSVEAVEVAKQVEKKQDALIVILRDQTAALLRIETKLEASLAKSEPQNGKDGDPASVSPDPPAKANDTQAPLKVATPGDSSEHETLVELATRLYASGVNVHNKTEDELRAIDAQMSGGQAVSGAMFQNNGASAITSKRSAVRFVPRGSGFVQWQNNSTQQSCGPNGCPPRRSH